MNRKKPKKQHYFVPKEITAEQTADEELKEMKEACFAARVVKISKNDYKQKYL